MPHPIDAGKQILLFWCANDPGMLEEWAPNGGGIAAVVVDATRPGTAIRPLAVGATTLAQWWGGHVLTAEAGSFAEAWQVADRDGQLILGRLGDEREWIQGDETPDCAACGRLMVLAAQLAEGLDERRTMSFGGCACGYVFACARCGDSASFLMRD